MDNNLLNNRITRLKEWEDKESLNEILYEALSSLNAYIKERFDSLNSEVCSELPLNDNRPIIKTAVCAEENISKHLYLYPVSTDPPIKSPGYVTTVFAECDYRTMQEAMNRVYPVKIQWKSQTIETQATLRYSAKYLQKLESLYYVFSENEVPWETVNSAYFYKFLDVVCKNDFPQGLGEIKSFDINFSPYEKCMSFDKALLWNISTLDAPVAVCDTRPAYNAVQYEHTLRIVKPEGQFYLVCPIGCKFTGFRRGNAMYVRTYNKKIDQFKLLRITENEDLDSSLYLPLKTNKKRIGYLDGLAEKKYIPTRGEAERIVHSLSEEADLRLADIKVLPATVKNVMRYKGIDYNFFIETNGFLTGKRFLLFTFEVNEDKVWAHEAMFYALSELQHYFYEYLCVGEML